MMPNGQAPLLLPVSQGFIWLSLFVAFALNLLPLGPNLWMPDFLLISLVFWNIHQPRRVGIALPFLFGLMMDVQESALLGQQALTYSVVGFLAISIHRRILWFSLRHQIWHLMPLFFLAHGIELSVRMMSGALFPGYSILFAPLVESLLWPLATVLLQAPQKRTPNPDETRPL